MKKNNLKLRLSLVTMAVMACQSAYSQQENSDSVSQSQSQIEPTETENEVLELEQLVVTGSRIVVDPTLSTRDITVIDREEIDRSAASTLQDLLRQLPQNIGATTDTGSGILGAQSFGLGPNVFGGSSVNLRGLGSQYSLVLIDGRRPAKGGLFGDITDISNIPLERIEQIEVLLDGAAAIYGSDAVGGVINIITRKDYAGTEVSVQLDGTEGGGGATKSLSLGHTFNLKRGSLSVNGSYRKTDSINIRQRDLDFLGAITFPLPPRPNGAVGNGQTEIMWVRDVNGDGDYNDIELEERLSGSVLYAVDSFGESTNLPVSRRGGLSSVDPFQVEQLSPAQVAEINSTPNPASVGYSPVYYASLPAYDNRPLNLYDVPYNLPAGASAEDQFRELGESSDPRAGQALTPEVKQYSVGFNFDYGLTDKLELNWRANVGRTNSISSLRPAGESLFVNADAATNPFSTSLNYAIDSGLPQEKNEVTTDNIDTAVTLSWFLNDNWELQANASYSEQESLSVITDSLFRESSEVLTPGGNLRNTFRGTLQGRLQGQDSLALRDENGNFEFIDVFHDNVNFNDPLLGFASREELIAGTINPTLMSRSDTSSSELELLLQGAVASLPGGDVVANMIVSRNEQKTSIGNTNNQLSINNVLPGSAFSFLDQEFTTETTSFGSEISVPIVGESNSRPYIKSLAFHGAFRIEDVNYFDEDAENWSLGFNYQPTDWLTLRLNRSGSKALPSAQLTQGGVTLSRTDTVLSTPGSFDLVPIDQSIYVLRGATDRLQPEDNDNLQLGIQIRPNDHFTFRTTYSDSETSDQVGTAGIDSSRLSLGDLNNVNRTPYFRTVTPDTVLFGRPFIDFEVQDIETGALFSPNISDFIVDQRNFNLRSTRVKSLDFQFNWRSGLTDYGEFFLKWAHNRTLEHEIVQNTLCRDNAENCNFFNLDPLTTGGPTSDAIGQPFDIVGAIDRRQQLAFGFLVNQQPISKDTGSLAFEWGRKGLTVGLRTNYSNSTDILNSDFEDDIDSGELIELPFIVRTRPSLGLDLNLSYNFSQGEFFKAPSILKNTTLFFSINDLVRRDEEVETIWLVREPSEGNFTGNSEFNAAAIESRGRSFSIRLRKTF